MADTKDAKASRKGKGKRKGKKKKRYLQAWQKLPEYMLWDQVLIRLKAGEACYSLAKWWKSQGKMTHLCVKTLAKYLGLYRTHEIPDSEKFQDGPLAESYRNELVKKFRGYIDVFEGLGILINVNWDRMQSALEKEQSINFPMEMTSKISDVLQGLYKDYFEILQKTGVLPQVPTWLHHTFGDKGKQNGRPELPERSEDSKRRIVEMSNTFIEKIKNQMGELPVKFGGDSGPVIDVTPEPKQEDSNAE